MAKRNRPDIDTGFLNYALNTSTLRPDPQISEGVRKLVNNIIENVATSRPIGPRPPVKPNEPPDAETGDRFVVPPEDLYAAKYNAGAKYYYMYYDEALRVNMMNALAMRRDGLINELLEHRQLATASLDWYIKPDDPKDRDQMEVAKQVEGVLQRASRFTTIVINMLEDVHFGKYGVQIQYGYKKIMGRNRVTVVNHAPVNGDKITYRYDGTPGILVYGGAEILNKPEYASRIGQATLGKALYLYDAYFRERFIISKFIPSDFDYIFESEKALGVHGIGKRDRMYWCWNMYIEVLSWILDALQRVGANGMTYATFESGNPQSEVSARVFLSQLVKDSYAVVGVKPGKDPDNLIRNIPVTPVGYEIMLKIVEYLAGILRRAYLGQELTSLSGSSGMGLGTARAHESSFHRIVNFDSGRSSETIDEELVSNIVNYNTWKYKHREILGSDLPFGLQFKFKNENNEINENIKTASTLHEMGVDLDEDDVRERSGYSPPDADGSILPGKSEDEQTGKSMGTNGSGKPSNGTGNGKTSVSPKIDLNRLRRDKNHEENFQFYKRSLLIANVNRGIDMSPSGEYPQEITRDEVGEILADQYHNIKRRLKGEGGVSKGELEKRWVVSDKFYLMKIPVDMAVPSRRVGKKDRTHSRGPIIIDRNTRGVGARLAKYGFTPEITVIDGKHRQAEAIRSGERHVWAYVGDQVIRRVEDRIEDDRRVASDRFERYQGGLEADEDMELMAESETTTATLQLPDHSDGVFIGLKVPSAVAQTLSFGLPGSPEPEEMHVTLAYLGKKSDVATATVNTVAELCGLLANATESIRAGITGVGRFEASESSNELDPIYAAVESPDLEATQKELVHILEMQGIEYSKEHEFIPHITLGYAEPGEDIRELEVKPMGLRFDSLALVVGGDWKYYYFK